MYTAYLFLLLFTYACHKCLFLCVALSESNIICEHHQCKKHSQKLITHHIPEHVDFLLWFAISCNGCFLWRCPSPQLSVRRILALLFSDCSSCHNGAGSQQRSRSRLMSPWYQDRGGVEMSDRSETGSNLPSCRTWLDSRCRWLVGPGTKKRWKKRWQQCVGFVTTIHYPCYMDKMSQMASDKHPPNGCPGCP